ncbi:LamG-like jellyroll fold domain-containing protein [Paractinoplanes rishiriensis]|nr:LamG-like jellyroll fold domain-containing protein [Actinoplanes rishiriensis]
MKKFAITLAAVAGMLIPATPALADDPPTGPTGISARPAVAPVAAPGVPRLVARWDFNAGPVAGKVADTSGRNQTLALRGADQGAVRFEGSPGGRFAMFPPACAAGATTCPRGLLEAANHADLNPGTRLFRWSARVQLTRAQLRGPANVMQKGVAGTGSQWKLQIGATNGRAQCVLAGTGAATVYIARSAASVADGAWHKLFCQRAGTSLSIFVDGIQRGQTTIPANLTVDNTMPLRLGGPNFNTRSDMYHGNLDDVYAELG